MQRRDVEVRGWVSAETRTIREGAEASEGLTLEGYAAMFDTESEPMMGGRETIARGAFTKALERDDLDVRILANHAGLALARTTNGSLELEQDDKGLRFTARLNPNVQAARDLHALVERGDVTQMSFGFSADIERVDRKDGGYDWRIREVDELYELSPVTFPAYRDTSVEARGGYHEGPVGADCEGENPDEVLAARFDLARRQYGGAPEAAAGRAGGSGAEDLRRS